MKPKERWDICILEKRKESVGPNMRLQAKKKTVQCKEVQLRHAAVAKRHACLIDRAQHVTEEN